MSNIRLSTINPFRSNKNKLPKLKFADVYNSTKPHQKFYGTVKKQEDYYKLQYIPSDSPIVEGIDMFELNGYEWKANTTNYKEDQMLYTVNKHGFRGDNFSTKDDAIMFLGCSFTFGIGVSDEDVWCRNVADKRNKKCWNLGVPGGGNQQIFLMLDSFLESGYRPSEVVILWTEPHRKLIFNGKTFNKQAEPVTEYKTFGQSGLPADPLLGYLTDTQSLENVGNELEMEIIEFTPVWNTDKDQMGSKAWTLMYEEHQWFDFYFQRSQVLNLLKLHNIPYTEMHVLPETAYFCQNMDRLNPSNKWSSVPKNLIYHDEKTKDVGRDSLHWGPNCHKNAEELYFTLNKSL